MFVVEGNKSIVTGTKTLIKASSSFILSTGEVETLSHEALVRSYYRRFFRLRPFISSRKMVRDTYTEYLRYKFRAENYELKRTKFLKENELQSYGHDETMKKSLEFVLKGVSTKALGTEDLSVDQSICRKILKNLLTVEYHKERLMNRSPKYYQFYRKEFSQLTDEKNVSLKHFEENMIRLNETLGTRL